MNECPKMVIKLTIITGRAIHRLTENLIIVVFQSGWLCILFDTLEKEHAEYDRYNNEGNSYNAK